MVQSPVLSKHRRPIQPADLFRMKRLSSPAVSPDGQWVACVVSRPDLDENRVRSAIHLVSGDGSELRPLTSGPSRDSSPVWDPEGRSLAFVSDRADGPNQLYVIPVDGGEARRVTDFPVAVTDPKWL